jgi:hypothetical protein
MPTTSVAPRSQGSAVAVRPPPRLRKPNYLEVDDATWDILCNSTFPVAKDPNMIALAWSLCKIRRLDIFRKPFHIIANWSSAANRMVEQLIPGINEPLVVASRTNEFAGVDKPVYGPRVTETFHGRRKRGNDWEDDEVTVTYPETVEVTVHRLVQGQDRTFVSPIHWREEYQRVGDGVLPNAMWCKRPYDQAQKVALAASLRIAFSDVVEAEPQDLGAIDRPEDAPIIDAEAEQPQPPRETIAAPAAPEPDVDPETGEVSPHLIGFRDDDEPWQQWCARYLASIATSVTEAELEQWIALNEPHLTKLKDEAPDMNARLEARTNKIRNEIKVKGEST